MPDAYEVKRYFRAIIQAKVAAVNSCELGSGAFPGRLIQAQRFVAISIFDEGSVPKGLNNKKLVETDITVLVITESQQDRTGDAVDADLSPVVVAIQNQLVNAVYMEHTALKTENIDNAAAVDKGGDAIGIPITGHGLAVDDFIIIEGTTSYGKNKDNENHGGYLIQSITADEIVVYPVTYVAETFTGGGAETVRTIEKVFMKNISILSKEALMGDDFDLSVIGQRIKCKVWHELA